jgi:hypothetical protein
MIIKISQSLRSFEMTRLILKSSTSSAKFFDVAANYKKNGEMIKGRGQKTRLNFGKGIQNGDKT